jgi:hypothetical protein
VEGGGHGRIQAILPVAAAGGADRLGSSFRWLCSMSRAGPVGVPHDGEVGEEQIHQAPLGDFRAAEVMANVVISINCDSGRRHAAQ